MGIGGAPEGVITAAALRCLNGEIQARLIVKDQEQEERMRRMGISDPNRVYHTEELACGQEDCVSPQPVVTDGSLLKGVRFFGDGVRTHSLDHESFRAKSSLYRYGSFGQQIRH